ncbi:hypothetical protein Pan97_02060 [Bremerella volcania]|uniref:HEAT repeat protein n=1 Tax=Bremerella volcania TaxID=2527984 RepID=A0A518C1Y6_9BACT|nr:hypothetical protein [Bremerella volcania]QDU73239.1 hypothetical protein Pan97_02060 [Bremerella volcania]
MHETEGVPSRRSFFQLRISSALFLLLLIGLGLGWWSDHTRLSQQLAKSELERDIKASQITLLNSYSVNPFGSTPNVFLTRSRRTFSFTAKSPEHFIELIRDVRTDLNAGDWAEALQKAGDDYDATVEKLIQLLSDPEDRIRRNACIVLAGQYDNQIREKMQKHHPELVRKLLDIIKLGTPTDSDTLDAIKLLGMIGPDAESAVGALAIISHDEKHPQAVFATIAIGNIRSGSDPGPRLIELLSAGNPAQDAAVIALLDIRPADEVRVLLEELYYTRQKDADKIAIAGLILRAGL